MRQLDTHDTAILSALTALGEGWHDRDEIAAKLGRYAIEGEDLLALESLVRSGHVDHSRKPGQGRRHVYRLAQNGDKS